MHSDLERLLDAPATRSPGLRPMLASFGHHDTLLDILEPLYAVANGGTFFGGLFRIIPLVGLDDEAGETVSDTVTSWNESGWKRWQPFFETSQAFMFASTALGDLFGVALGADGAVVDARVVVLRTSTREVETLGVTWNELFTRLDEDREFQTAVLDAPFARSAIASLGRPDADAVLSWKIPPRLGGAREIDNLDPSPLSVHVDFTLQLLHQALVVHRLAPGQPLPPVEIVETAEGEMRVLLQVDD